MVQPRWHQDQVQLARGYTWVQIWEGATIENIKNGGFILSS